MDCDVEPHQFNKRFVIAETEEGCQIVGVVLCGIDGRKFAFAEDIAINAAGDVG